MNKDIIVEKIKYLTSLPHSALVEHCIYLENENDNYKAQKYITDFISENGVICKKNKEIEQLQQKIDKAIEYIKNWVLDEYSIAVIDKEDDMCCYIEPNAKEILLEILGDKENERT